METEKKDTITVNYSQRRNMAEKYVKNISLALPMSIHQKLEAIVANTKVGDKHPTIRSIILLAVEEAIQKFEDANILEKKKVD